MENKTLTAVEWLAEKYNYITWMRNRDEMSPETADNRREYYLEQAQAMFQEQIIDAWRNGDNDSMYSPKELDQQAEQYYNETYKNK